MIFVGSSREYSLTITHHLGFPRLKLLYFAQMIEPSTGFLEFFPKKNIQLVYMVGIPKHPNPGGDWNPAKKFTCKSDAKVVCSRLKHLFFNHSLQNSCVAVSRRFCLFSDTRMGIDKEDTFVKGITWRIMDHECRSNPAGPRMQLSTPEWRLYRKKRPLWLPRLHPGAQVDPKNEDSFFTE